MKRICKYCGAEFDGQSRDIRCPECRKLFLRPPTERICRQCGKTFMAVGSRAFFCPDCRAERQKEANARCYARKKAGKTRKIGSTDICQKCGASYTVNGGLQRYCPACAEENKMMLNREQALENYYNGGKERREARVAGRAIATQKCVVCGKEFQQDGARLLCCSDECSRIHAQNLKDKWADSNKEYVAQLRSKWENENREARAAYHREQNRKKMAAMSPEEYKLYREEERRRRKAKEAAMSPDEYRAYREKINARARELYKKRKDEG